MSIPPLITTEGLVLNNQFTGGALGGYTPPGTASSEGISLMLRGMIRAAIATGDEAKKEFAKFLFNAACTYFFKGVRPTSVEGQEWNHSWIVNGGKPFFVRGPLDQSGDLALSGYLYTRNPESTITFTNGVGQLTPAPDIVYQVVSANSTFVWDNMFAELLTGAEVDVDYYIDVKGNKIFGTQRGGSFGQPIVPSGQHTDGGPGKIALKTAYSGVLGVNYSVTVPGIAIAYGELYEAWPMWRKLAAEEVSTAADAIHWFLDAFRLGMELEPTNVDWVNAHNQMLAVWEKTCEQESNTTRIFQAGANGPYNNFPLTYGYAYGRSNIDDDTSNWSAIPPTPKYTAIRTLDGFVTFTFPNESADKGSGQSIRYGAAFENSPLFLEYTEDSSMSLNMRSSVQQVIQAKITSAEGESHEASIVIGPTTVAQSVGLNQFLKYQQEPGDSLGVKSGDWGDIDNPDDEDWEPPEYFATGFPGRRAALIGDSITWMNSFWNPAGGMATPWNNNNSSGWGGAGGGGSQPGYYEYYANAMCGYFTYANAILGQRLELEPAISAYWNTDNPASRYRNGNNFAIAGSRTTNWHLALDNTLNDGVLEVGPMFNARRHINDFDVVVMMGGTNDIAGDVSAQTVFQNLRNFAYEFAMAGKWVFLQTVPPRTVEWLGGYYSPAGAGWMGTPDTVNPAAAYNRTKQEQTRDRLIELNELIREWIAQYSPPNIWLVDTYADLLGPNGRDPFGSVTNEVNPLAQAGVGNFRSDLPNLIAMYDGLHPSSAGAYIMGKKMAQVMTAAGVPAKGSSLPWPHSVGANLVANPNFNVTTVRPKDPAGFSNVMGRAVGLGQSIADATHQHWTGAFPLGYDYRQNLGLGYQYGQMPDYWQFYRSQNTFPDPVNEEGFANFNEYTWESLSQQYPTLTAYMQDSTWANGAVTTSIVTDNGVKALRIQVNMPQTGNKNESFILRTTVPHGQHGKWDNYGYAMFDYDEWFKTHTVGPTQDEVNTVINNMYSTGDRLFAEAKVKLSGVSNMYTWRMALNFLSIDSSAVSTGDTTTTGAKISAFAFSQNFWPPTMINKLGMVPNPDEMTFRTPSVQAPVVSSLMNQVYLQYNFEFAFDCSTGPATAVILIKNPGVFKIFGGS